MNTITFIMISTTRSLYLVGLLLASSLATAQLNPDTISEFKTGSNKDQAPARQATVGPTDLHESESQVLATAVSLLKAGALNLALDHLTRNPPRTASVDDWQAWAEQKWSLLILLEDWETLRKDAKGLPASFGGVRDFAISYEARALIALGEYNTARRILQPALDAQDIPLRLQKDIRLQLISLYQAQGDYSNAKIEAIRYHDEFKPQNSDWFLKRAVIEYLSGDPAAANSLVAAIASIKAKLLQALFRYEAGEIEQSQASSLISKQLDRKRITARERKFAYGILAKISAGSEVADLRKRVIALEKYLIVDEPDLYKDVIHFQHDALMDAYLVLSEALVNQAKLDTTRASLKFTLGQQKEQAAELTEARALYAGIIKDNQEPTLTKAAKDHLVKGLLQAKKFPLLKQLFGTNKLVGDFSGIDSTASALILNQALDKGDAELISSIAPYLDIAPENVADQDWLLQKARIDIFAGRFAEGQSKIIDWLNAEKTLSGELVDRVLQPVFDLQAVHEDALSLSLLEKISQQTNSSRHKREILFWKAQSYEALDDRTLAAQFYLRSALAKDNGFDQWGHSARYHAASNLMESGDFEDARVIFEGLLKAASDASRRGTIKQALQRLWLLENRSTEVDK